MGTDVQDLWRKCTYLTRSLEPVWHSPGLKAASLLEPGQSRFIQQHWPLVLTQILTTGCCSEQTKGPTVGCADIAIAQMPYMVEVYQEQGNIMFFEDNDTYPIVACWHTPGKYKNCLVILFAILCLFVFLSKHCFTGIDKSDVAIRFCRHAYVW